LSFLTIWRTGRKMANEVELVIKADTSQYVKGIKDAQKATEDLYTTTVKGQQRQKGLIEDLKETITGYQRSLEKAMKEETITKYNRKIAEANMELKRYQELGVKAEKSTESLTASIGKWALSLGGAAMILNKLKDAFLQTTAGINIFNHITNLANTALNDFVTTGRISVSTLKQSAETQKVLNALRLEEYLDGVKLSKLNITYQENYVKALDQTLSKEDKLKAIDAALAAHNEKINIQIEHATKQAEAIRKQIDNTTVPSEKMVAQYAKLIADINNLEAERDASTKRLQSRRSGIIQEEIEKEKKQAEDLNDYLVFLDEEYTKKVKEEEEKKAKIKEEFLGMFKQLQDDYDKAQIASLTGVDKLRAEREFALKQLDIRKKQMQELGTLTPEMEDLFRKMGELVQKAFVDGMTEEIPAKVATEDLLSNYADSLKEGIQGFKVENKPKEEGDSSIWSLLGINPDDEKGQKAIEAFKQIADTTVNVLEETFARRVEIAQRERELLDTQIAESQRALEMEQQLAEEGYANNVALKQKELDKLKKQREKALLEEEKAIKKQQQLETIMQVASLITAAAQTFKVLNGPLLPLGIAAVAAMFVAFASAKASAAAATKLAEGGSGSDVGMITGRSHGAGGERFLDHVEVERGEIFGVLSRKASDKYGQVFHEMVSSFNRDEMPNFIAPPISNSVRIENSGPNSRLDRVIKEQEKMNVQLKQGQLITSGNKRIIKSGNKIRIVG